MTGPRRSYRPPLAKEARRLRIESLRRWYHSREQWCPTQLGCVDCNADRRATYALVLG